MADREVRTTDGHLDEETLSAYLDAELAPAERRRVEAHLLVCKECLRELRMFQALGAALREDAAPVPPSLAADLRARIGARPRPRGFALVPALVSVAAGLTVVFLASAIFGMWSETPPARAYPAPNATGVAVDTTVEIVYPAGVDKDAVAAAVVIEPPVPVRVEWRGDTLVLKPEKPLSPATNYSVRAPAAPPRPAAPVPPLPQLPSTAPTPTPAVVTSFVTAPVAVAAAATPSEAAHDASARPAEARALAAAAEPSPAPSQTAEAPVAAMLAPAPSPSPGHTPQGTPTPDREPVRGFGLVYRDNPDVRAALGRPLADEQAVALIGVEMQLGIVFWRGDERLIYVLASDGTWSSHPDVPQKRNRTPTPTLAAPQGASRAATPAASDTATPVPSATATPTAVGTQLPTPSATATPTATPVRRAVVTILVEDVRKQLGHALGPERAFRGAVQSFERGTMLWSDRRAIYVLYADGHWEEYPDLYEEPTATPTVTPPAATAAATGTPTATPIATPTPAPTGTPQAACAITPVRGFGHLYAANDALREALGCPLEGERPLALARQPFAGGLMLWRGDKRIIYALADGSWLAFEDTFVGDEPQASETPPAGFDLPRGGFGKVWRERPDVRELLGWATGPEAGLAGAVQAFEGGTLLWSGAGEIHALFVDGSWEAFPDEFAE